MKKIIATAVLVGSLSVTSAAMAQTDLVVTPEHDATESVQVEQPDSISIDTILTNSTYDYAGDGTFYFYQDGFGPGETELRVHIANAGTQAMSYKHYTPDGRLWASGTLNPGQSITSTTIQSDPVSFYGNHMVKVSNATGSVGKVTISARTI